MCNVFGIHTGALISDDGGGGDQSLLLSSVDWLRTLLWKTNIIYLFCSRLHNQRENVIKKRKASSSSAAPAKEEGEGGT
jgi:hypothetical protein